MELTKKHRVESFNGENLYHLHVSIERYLDRITIPYIVESFNPYYNPATKQIEAILIIRFD